MPCLCFDESYVCVSFVQFKFLEFLVAEMLYSCNPIWLYFCNSMYALRGHLHFKIGIFINLDVTVYFVTAMIRGFAVWMGNMNIVP